MTAWSMFANADWVVKSVMIILVAASVAAWAIWAAKTTEYRKSRKLLAIDLGALAATHSLGELPDLKSAAAAELAAAASAEAQGAVSLMDSFSTEAVRERVAIRFGAIEARLLQAKQEGFSVLASIGATAPFVGLFGTVWGIMNSFIGISKAQTTNLAVVAPGIAEALLATAFGLVAAIPAVLIYNMLTRVSASYRRQLREVSAMIACALSRDIERAQAGRD
jgi:biopolymer transport protein ExbB